MKVITFKRYVSYSITSILLMMCFSLTHAANNPNTHSNNSVVVVTQPEVAEATPMPQPESQSTLSWFNHAVFNFNDMLDRAILKPVAKLYRKLVPRPVHQGVTNFFGNIDTLTTVINDVLQLQGYYTLNDSWRFFVNTTFGILGFIDVGSRIGLKPHHEDFGLTLAHWGYKDSNYIVVPFLGPGTIRDIIGWPIDYFFFSIYPYIPDQNVRYGVYGLGIVDRRANVLQYQDVLGQVAVDRYSFMRNAYLQHRQYQIEENLNPKSNKDDVNEEASEGF
jgi:phospholipid-binding lipoprotein MlaA